MIQPVHTDAVPLDHAGLEAHHRAVGRYGGEHHRIGSHPGVVANIEGAQHLGAGSNHHVVADGRMALALLFTRSAKSYSLIQYHIVTDFAGFPDDDTHTVVNKQPVADNRSRVNLNAGKKAAHL
ncbi:hypothetical protein D3C76_1272280 [compost metagenome]